MSYDGDGADGWAADKFFSGAAQGYGFDDIVFLPGPCSITPKDVKLETKFTRNISLNVPMVASPADNVSEENMAIALALMGSIGVIHRNQSIVNQAAMVKKVKSYESGFIMNPRTLGPKHTVADASRLQNTWGISCLPITDNGRMGGKLVGIVTKRDVEGVEDKKTKIADIMVTNYAYLRAPVTFPQAMEAMRNVKMAKMPVVDDDNFLVALICRGDVKRSKDYPNASKDKNRQLLVAGALRDDELERARALIDAGVDAFYLETEEGMHSETLDCLKQLKATYQNTDVMVGPITSPWQARDLCASGVDALRVAGSDNFAASLVYEIAKYARNNYGIPVLADSRIHNESQMLKALCLGASTVAINELLEGTEETPGQYFYQDGVRMKLRQHPDQMEEVPTVSRYGPTSNSRIIETSVACSIVNKGSVRMLVPYLLQGLKNGLKELCIKNLPDIGNALGNGSVRMERQLPCKRPATHPPLTPVMVSSLNNRW